MRVNDAIRAHEVRLVGADGRQMGVVTLREAKRVAEESGMDLVEVVSSSMPPVCKVINYDKFRYQLAKKNKDNKSKDGKHQSKPKEIKIKPSTDRNDIVVKTNKIREFLSRGEKVKVTCTFFGRSILHPEVGISAINGIAQDLGNSVVVEGTPKLIGRNYSVVLRPATNKHNTTKSPGDS